MEREFKKSSKRYSSLKKEHAGRNSKIEELLKHKDDYIARLDSHKSALEKLEKENYSLKVKMNELHAKLATSIQHMHLHLIRM